MPNRRRFGRVNVICLCSGRGREEKGGNGDWVRGLKMGKWALIMGPARAEVRSCVQRVTIPSKRVIPNCSVSRRRPQKVDKRMVLEHTHGLFIT